MSENPTFRKLKSLLCKYEPQLTLLHDKADNYYLNTPKISSKKQEFFGAVQLKKSYVAYHLIPVYYHPDLLVGVSQALKDRMQGKSCFNFKEIDNVLLGELAALTETAFEHYRSLNKI